MFDLISAADLTVLAQSEIFDTAPTAPEGFTGPLTALVGIARWVGFFLVGIGLIVMAATMAISKREGTSEEATSNALRLGFAALILGAVSSIVGVLMG